MKNPVRPSTAACWTAAAVALSLSPLHGFLSDRVPVGRDLLFYFYPIKVRLAEAVRAGEVPWLDPYRWGGTSLLALPGAQAFHPANILFLLFGPGTAMKAWIALHVVAGVVGFSLFARRLGVPPRSAALAALIFSLSGVSASLLVFPTSLSALVLLPWLGAGALRVARDPGPSGALALALPATLLLLAALPEFFLFGIFFSLATFLVGVLARDPARSRRRAEARLAVWFAVSFLVALLAAAPSVTGTALTGLSSIRGSADGLDQKFAALGALPLSRFVEFLGDGLLVDWATHGSGPSGERYPYFPSLTPGIAGLALAGLGLAAGGRGRLAAVLLVVTGILLAVGSLTPLSDLVIRLAPPLKGLRYPEKYLVLSTLGASWLAGLGAAALETRLVPSRPALFLSLIAAVVVLERAPAATALLLLDGKDALAAPPSVLVPLLSLASPGEAPPRVFHLDGIRPVPVFYCDLLSTNRMSRAAASPAYGGLFNAAYVFEVDYDVALPRVAEEWEGFFVRALPQGTALPIAVARFAGASAVVWTDIRASGRGRPAIHLLPDAVPPYRFASRVVSEEDGAQLFRRFLEGGADPWTAWLPAEGGTSPERFPSPGRILSVADRPSGLRMDVEVDGPRSGLLQLFRLHEACREATLDGIAVPVLEANFGFAAVEVPAGRHMLDLRPATGWFPFSLAASAAGLAGMGVLAILGRRSRPKGSAVR